MARMKCVLVLVMLAACGDSKPVIHVTGDNICDQIATAACYDMYRCCDDSVIDERLGTSSVPTQDVCVNDLRGTCESDPELAKVQASVAARHMSFDANALTACLNALVEPADRCTSATIPWASACMTSAWVGIVPLNGTCANSLECADPTTYCGTMMSSCVPKPHAAQPCTPGGCTPGTWCSSGNTCRAVTAHGAACTVDEECGPDFACAADGTCEAIAPPASVSYCDAAMESMTVVP